MKWLYAAFDTVVIAGPLLASRLWLRDFWRQKQALFMSLGTVALPWALMDVAAHYWGWWQYNPQYIFGVRFFGLPIEEIVFFIAVPFACLVVWHAAQRFKGGVPPWVPRAVFVVLVIACAGLIALHIGRWRTVFDASIVIITVAALWGSDVVRHKAWWYWNGMTLGLFLVCNAILTTAPVVVYDISAATGWRVGSIPIEDFLYNFSLLNLLVLAYERCKK